MHWSALVANTRGAVRAIDAGHRRTSSTSSRPPTRTAWPTPAARRAEAAAAIGEIAALAHGAGGGLEVIIATAWDCPFDGRTDPARTLDVVRQAVAPGRRPALPRRHHRHRDPAAHRRAARRRPGRGPGLDRSACTSTTPAGPGQANALAAIQAGVTQLDASVGGLGGCPFAPGASGNIATEELVYWAEESGIATGLDLDAVVAAARVTEQAVGHELPSSLSRAGGRSVPRGPFRP